MALLPFNMEELDVYSTDFNSSQQQYMRRYNGITQSGSAILTRQEPQGMHNKREIAGRKILQLVGARDFGLGINNHRNVDPDPAFGNLDFLDGDILPENGSIQVSCEPSEEEPCQNDNSGTRDFEELIVNASDVVEQENVGSLGINDPAIAAALEILNSSGISKPVEFTALPAEKKRNPPYLVKGDSKIATRNEEPVKFCLGGAKVCQVVKISMRYSEEKFKNTPVNACPLHIKGKNGNCNFEVSTKVHEQCRYDDILGHYTASLTLCADNFDLSEDFKFFITFRCLNSCHKENGKKMELIMTLIDLDGKALKESRFEIRACKNVKRDYKEAFQDEEPAFEKQMQPDTFISAEYPQPSSSVVEEVKPVKSKEKTVKMKMIYPAGEAKRIKKEHHQEGAVQVVQTSATETYQQKYYLVRLPDAKKEKLALAVIKEFGGDILNLDSVVQADVNVEDIF